MTISFILEVLKVLHDYRTLVKLTTSFRLTSISEKSIRKDRSISKWSEYFFRSGNLLQGKNQPLFPKMKCHHHHAGNRTLTFHLPLRLVSRYFRDAPRSPSIRGWPVRLAEFLSDRGTTGSSSSCRRCLCVAERWRTATNVYFCCCNKCFRPFPHLLYALWCHRYRW